MKPPPAVESGPRTIGTAGRCPARGRPSRSSGNPYAVLLMPYFLRNRSRRSRQCGHENPPGFERRWKHSGARAIESNPPSSKMHLHRGRCFDRSGGVYPIPLQPEGELRASAGTVLGFPKKCVPLDLILFHPDRSVHSSRVHSPKKTLQLGPRAGMLNRRWIEML